MADSRFDSRQPDDFADATDVWGASPSPAAGGGLSPGGVVALVLGAFILVGAVVAAVVLGGRMVWGPSSDPAGDGDVSTVVETVTAEPDSQSARPDEAELPTATDSRPRTVPSKSLTSVSVSGPTSWAFAYQVQADVLAYYDSHGTIPAAVESYSPTTGKTYRMTCDEYTTYVHCHGGNDAHVYLE